MAASATSARELSGPAATPPQPIRSAAVLGAGTMGSRIAAHLANAGLPVLLLDVPSADPNQPSLIAANALSALQKSKPAAFLDPSLSRLVSCGNFDDDLEKLRGCDWIIEAVVEDLDIKQSLLRKIYPFVGATAIVTTNTSGLPVADIAAAMPADFRHRWFGTHFFNPPRYMRLVELIPTPETDPKFVDLLAEFCDKRLVNTVRLMMEQDLTVEEVDALTGSAIGWPKTGTFRLADMVGVDVLGHVAQNFARQAAKIGDERADVRLPDFILTLLERKWLGDKTKQGFYKKEKDAEGKEVRLALDWK